MDGDGSLLSVIIILAVLLLLAAYFAVAETSMASVSKVRIKMKADRGDGRAKKALWVLENFDRAITTILIGTNIVHISAATIVTVTVTNLVTAANGDVGAAVTVSTFVTTLVVFFAGEMLPKSLAKKYSERLSLAVAGSLSLIMKILRPVAAVLTAIGNFASHFVKSDPEISVTEAELYDIIEDMTEDKKLSSEQGELISSALQFGGTTVESILTSRVDLAAIDVSMSSEDILDYIRNVKHSRLPVYEGSIDNIIGILQIRTYIKAYLHGEISDIRSLLDEAYFVHESMMIDDLLPVMSKKRLNMAVVTDSYGGTLGIVTVEDILEELVGEIWDEDDDVSEPYRQTADGAWDCDAEMALVDVFELMEFDDADDEDDISNKLLGKWAYEQFAAIPKTGDSFEYHGLKVTVSEMVHNRIMRLTLSRIEEGGANA